MIDKKRKKRLTVEASYPLSSTMQRIEFSTDEMHYFSHESAGQYVKLMFTPAGDTDLALLKIDEQPVLRTYTLSAVDLGNKRLTIDFVKHSGGAHLYTDESLQLSRASGGHGHYFAEHAAVGEVIFVRGPGTIQAIDLHREWLLLIADMTAIAALSQVLKQVPSNARGHLVVELASHLDMVPWLSAMDLPKDLTLTLCLRGQGASLAETVQQLSWLDGQPSVWCACEFSDMKAIRHYVTDLHQVARSDCYFSSYWKQGVTEDGHKGIKQQDKESAKLP
ncbi:siderophore-interacting protein [Oceanisphaera avium]|nr:siderophore-interacting protein [Oceanisphaera avium]